MTDLNIFIIQIKFTKTKIKEPSITVSADKVKLLIKKKEQIVFNSQSN